MATPVISSQTGTFSHGAAVTIGGTSFETKATAAPQIWDNCSGTDPLDLYDGAWPTLAVGGAANYLTYRTAQRSIPMPHSRTTKYLAGCHNPGGDAEGGNNVMFWKNCTFVEGLKSVMVWYSRMDDNWAFQDGSDSNHDNNLKHWDYSNGLEPYDLPNTWYTQWFADSPPANAGCPSNSYVNVYNINDDLIDPPGPSITGGVAYGASNYINPFAGAWVKIEMAILYSTTAGFVQIAENGVTKFSYSGPTDKMAGTSRTEAIGGYARAQGLSSQWRYFADVYWDNCFNAVMLGNASTKAACTVLEYQIPTAWGDTSIEFTGNLGKFGDNDNAWLYVRNAAGLTNSSGFGVTLGTLGATGGPATGGGLSVPSQSPKYGRISPTGGARRIPR